ncbi:MAG: hypothetical protein DWQ06_12765 [Calditrichaeota bacterium]|nr:MAG: hypothetical protein DWQ06_12765 [Calditrichota bacterium]
MFVFKKTYRFLFLIFSAMLMMSFQNIASDRDSTDVEEEEKDRNIYYVCVENATDERLFYSAGWCEPSGKNWNGYENYTIGPQYVVTHKSPPGLQRLNLKIYSSGKVGKYAEYPVLGTIDGCLDGSTIFINFNGRGFLRVNITGEE